MSQHAVISSQLKEVQEELQELSDQSRKSDQQQEKQQRESARRQEEQEEQHKITERQEEELKELRYRTHLEPSCYPLPPSTLSPYLSVCRSGMVSLHQKLQQQQQQLLYSQVDQSQQQAHLEALQQSKDAFLGKSRAATPPQGLKGSYSASC